ncbi:MAG: type I 3-dehydroquinate dehydratase [Treponema sp.]|nr:type I 3-dehydroquinate dehydratase [Treponema sp.]
MVDSLICLTLTGKTLAEDAELARKYAPYVDLVELRADHLTEEEQLSIRRFPSMVSMPCILTVRRDIDGGLFKSGEFSRTALFARALSFAEQNPNKNFAYVDFEEDFHVSGLQDGTQAFGVKIIRSCHDFSGPVTDIRKKFVSMRKTSYEIPKLAFMPKTLSDVERLYRESSAISDFDHIVVAMGNLGVPSRILAHKFNSYLTYTSPLETAQNTAGIGHIDPITLTDMYNFRNFNDKTRLYAVTGWPLKVTSSPKIHNEGYKKHNLNNVFIPLASTSFAESLSFADTMGIRGMAVTVPYKEDVLNLATEVDTEVGEIGASNTVVKDFSQWVGHNTDAYGFSRALCEFLGVKNIRHRRVAIIGAGGAAKAIAFAIKQLGGKACVFNRTVGHAKTIADQYGFEYAPLEESCAGILDHYSDIIIQTTNVGMNSADAPNKENNPIWFYTFKGTENLFDIVYDPEVTPVMKVAQEAGCKVCNGYAMLKYQGYRQFKYFTGKDYE